MELRILIAVLPRWNLMVDKIVSAAKYFGGIEFPYRSELRSIKTLKINTKKRIILDLESISELIKLFELSTIVPGITQRQWIGKGFNSFRELESFVAKDIVGPNIPGFFFKRLSTFTQNLIVSPVSSFEELQTIKGFEILPISRQGEVFKDFDIIKSYCGRGLILEPWVRESDIVKLIKHEFPHLK